MDAPRYSKHASVGNFIVHDISFFWIEEVINLHLDNFNGRSILAASSLDIIRTIATACHSRQYNIIFITEA